MSDILKKYVCTNPFRYLDIQSNSQWICCPSWAPTNIRVDKHGKELKYFPIKFDESEILNNWESNIAQDIRRSVIDGTYDHCDHKVCPSLSELISTGNQPHNFITKEEFEKTTEIYSVDDLHKFKGKPEEILFGFDRSCNLKCPSCRDKLIPNDDVDSEDYKIKKFLLDQIETHFSESAKKLLITGSGDPFYSKIYRDYLVNFDSNKYPNLEQIQIITNGILLNKKMWESLKSKEYIKVIEISVDAGTKETYENITRLNGDWDKLIENIKYLSTQDTIDVMIFSMVVSQVNYKEMPIFYDIITEIFKNSKIKIVINFRQHVYWGSGALSIQEVKDISVFEKHHSEFNKFIDILRMVKDEPYVNHNFHHLFDE
jgi:MoaA/NifB/PqqE/SkfB family radical SAM enzyme